MSLGGLALATGMVVDDSIVVLENVARMRERGMGALEAAIKGTTEVGMAVTASTLTTVAVFFPLVFVQGVAGSCSATRRSPSPSR
jgi:HAE1 family hydrophobic/amphiphilic exporter-1